MSESDSGRTLTIVAYVLHILGAITGILSIVALVMNYVVRGDHGAMIDSHQSWMIRTFWYAVLWCVVCILLVITVIGIPLAWIGGFITWIWYLYRHIRGLIDLSDNKPMPAT